MRPIRLFLSFALATLPVLALAGCAADEGQAPSGPAGCGNGVLDKGEECDGAQLGLGCAGKGFSAGGATCNADCTLNTAACCQSACTPGAARCNGAISENCNLASNGCALWVPIADCASFGQKCQEANGKAECGGGCADACDTEGQTQCNGDVVETCGKAASGCLVWTQTTDCAAQNKSCDATGGPAKCSDSCANQCPSWGDKQCSGNVIQTCLQAGNCTQWTTTQDCADIGQQCLLQGGGTPYCGGGCTNKCPTAGNSACFGQTVNACEKQANKCLDWSPKQTCGAGYTCKQNGTQASCEPDCQNPCSTLGAKQCVWNSIQTCTQKPNSCLEWTETTLCAVGQTCSASGGTPTCVTAPTTGEDCSTAVSVKGGVNTVNWTATKNDHMSPGPSCATNTTGPDVVVRYTPTFSGSIGFEFEKPASTRWVAIADGACPPNATPSVCATTYTEPYLNGETSVVKDKPVYIYISATTTGGIALSNPLKLTINEYDCTKFKANATTFDPVVGGTTTSLAPKLNVSFDTPMLDYVGIVTLTGDKGTSLSFDQSKVPPELKWSTDKRTLTITPGTPFKAGEKITVTWSGLKDGKCFNEAATSTWSFNVIVPPCAPGTGGMVGANLTKVSTGITPTVTEYYMAADSAPNGWVYLGGTAQLWRVPKAGGTPQDVYAAATLNTTHVGYGMLVDGSDVFTIEYKTSGTTGHFFRLTDNGGASWSAQDFTSFPSQPTDAFRGATSYKGKVYLATSEISLNVDTQIWSVDAGAGTLPKPAALVTSFGGERYCNGITMDDKYFYLTCALSNRVVRVDRATNAVSLLTDIWTLNTTKSEIHAHDTNGDGTADFLYFKGSTSDVYFVCNPAGATPYTDKLVSFGNLTSTYGLGWDSAQKTLWAYDDSSKELVAIK